MGELELVLDSLTVEDALRIVGGAVPAGSAERPSGNDAPLSEGGTADWRAALRATGSEPEPRERLQTRPPPPRPAAPPAEVPARPPSVQRAATREESRKGRPADDLPAGLTVGSEIGRAHV